MREGLGLALGDEYLVPAEAVFAGWFEGDTTGDAARGDGVGRAVERGDEADGFGTAVGIGGEHLEDSHVVNGTEEPLDQRSWEAVPGGERESGVLYYYWLAHDFVRTAGFVADEFLYVDSLYLVEISDIGLFERDAENFLRFTELVVVSGSKFEGCDGGHVDGGLIGVFPFLHILNNDNSPNLIEFGEEVIRI